MIKCHSNSIQIIETILSFFCDIEDYFSKQSLFHKSPNYNQFVPWTFMSQQGQKKTMIVIVISDFHCTRLLILILLFLSKVHRVLQVNKKTFNFNFNYLCMSFKETILNQRELRVTVVRDIQIIRGTFRPPIHPRASLLTDFLFQN